MAASDAPVQVIHGLAGSGKSTIIQCLVALCAKHHAEQLGLRHLVPHRWTRRPVQFSCSFSEHERCDMSFYKL